MADSQGLSQAEVDQRIQDGRVNTQPKGSSTSVSQIVASNVFTPVNAIIGVLFVLILIARRGPSPDMLFAGVIVANSLIGSIQELRARTALNRLAILDEPTVSVVRDGTEIDVASEYVVADDMLILRLGGQVVVDGIVTESSALEVDESLLTGESEAVIKAEGDEILSGSFVASGAGKYVATKVGEDSYASTLANEAMQFSLVDSELRTGINKLLRVLMFLIPPIGLLLLWRLLDVSDDWGDALAGMVAATVAMVPDGLVLLTSVAFMAGVIRLSRKDALLREIAAVELLARVDVLCLDKTGTITSGEIALAGVDELASESDSTSLTAADCLASMGASDPNPNATLTAIAKTFSASPNWTELDTIAFSSARKWSAAAFETPLGAVALYLGAPEFLISDNAGLTEDVERHAQQGNRVVLLARAELAASRQLAPESQLPPLTPVALVILEDQIRSDAPDTLRYLNEQGIQLKVISGDHPDTVATVAARAGVTEPSGALVQEGVDASQLPDDPAELATAIEASTVLGRVTPKQKQEMVAALQSNGHTVAMTGDGVNDVLALKNADMGIAMGAGSPATRAVAQVVLLNNHFNVLPVALAEGRRVINSVERAANLFVYGTVYSIAISLVIAAIGVDYPFLPRHLTLVRVLSVGIPGIFLALAPDARRVRLGFINRVVKFSVPAGLAAGSAALCVYLVGRASAGTSLIEARSAATITLLATGLVILLRLTRTLPRWRWGLVAAMSGSVIAVLVIPWLSEVFELDMPPLDTWIFIGAVVAVAAVAISFIPVSADSDESLHQESDSRI